jgi:hypothetical protein
VVVQAASAQLALDGGIDVAERAQPHKALDSPSGAVILLG